jgi:hypothetical protein
VSTSGPGRWPGLRRGPAGRSTAAPQVRLVTRLVVAQAAVAALVGLPFSRRHLPSVLITVALVALCCLLALLVRSGTRAAWLVAVGAESVFFVYGVSRFVVARYVGGTLFALIIAGALLHPAVARAYSAVPGQLPGHERGEVGFGDATGETFGGHAAG